MHTIVLRYRRGMDTSKERRVMPALGSLLRAPLRTEEDLLRGYSVVGTWAPDWRLFLHSVLFGTINGQIERGNPNDPRTS